MIPWQRRAWFCVLGCSLMFIWSGCEDGTPSSNAPENCIFGNSENACQDITQSRCSNGESQACTLDESTGCFVWRTSAVNYFDCKACTDACVSGSTRCSGREIQACTLGASGCLEWTTTETCPKSCQNSACSECATSCEEQTYQCFGKTLKKCTKNAATGCFEWATQKSCTAYCKAEYGSCTEDLPTCQLKSGAKATILQWNDGDTLWLRAKSDGKCNDFEWTADAQGVEAWRPVRYKVRVLGIDAPECTKVQNSYHYYECVKDTQWNYSNEQLGYESWQKAVQLLPKDTEVVLTCDQKEKDGTCALDSTDGRILAYLGYTKGNASYDFSTEITRAGYAFANVEFSSTTSKIGAICSAQKEAIQSRTGVWSLASTVNGVLNKMSTAKQKNLRNLESRCNTLMK